MKHSLIAINYFSQNCLSIYVFSSMASIHTNLLNSFGNYLWKHFPASHVIYQTDMGKTLGDPKLSAGTLKGQTKLCMRTD